MRAPTVSYSMAGASPANASVVLPIDRRGYFLRGLSVETVRAPQVDPPSRNYTLLVELLDGEGGVTQAYYCDESCERTPGRSNRFDLRDVVPTRALLIGLGAVYNRGEIYPEGETSYFAGQLPAGLWVEPGQRVRVSLPGANDTTLGASYADQWRKIHVVISYP